MISVPLLHKLKKHSNFFLIWSLLIIKIKYVSLLAYKNSESGWGMLIITKLNWGLIYTYRMLKQI